MRATTTARTFEVKRKISDRRSIFLASRQSTAVHIQMMRGPKDEYTLAERGSGSIGNGSPIPHIPVVSMLLYAHAAAAPEYEYPACLYRIRSVK